MTTVSDSFQRANGPLGTAPSGLAWQVLAGTAAIAADKATATTDRTETGRTIAVLPVSADGVFTLTLPAAASGGECLYFRVADANNWWRLRVVASLSSYQYVSGYTCQKTIYYEPGSTEQSSFNSSTDQSSDTTVSGTPYWQCTTSNYHYDPTYGYELDSQSSFESSSDLSNGNGVSGDGGAHVSKTSCYYVSPAVRTQITCSPNYATGTTTTYTAYLDKCVAGTITSTPLNTLARSATLQVTTAGQAITASDGTHNQGVLDAANQSATGVGLGSGPSSQGNSPLSFVSLQAVFTPTGDSAGPVLLG